MAYEKKFFTLGRGSYNNYATLDNAAQHIYKTAVDTLATILAPGYFPENFNFDLNNVKIGDIIDIYGSDFDNKYVITNVTAPTFSEPKDLSNATFVFGTNLIGIFAAPQPITITFRKIGDVVTVFVPNATAVATIAANMTTSAQVGAALVPELTIQNIVPVVDNGLVAAGALKISGLDDPGNEGLFTWGAGPGLGTFTGTNSSGTERCSTTYFTA